MFTNPGPEWLPEHNAAVISSKLLTTLINHYAEMTFSISWINFTGCKLKTTNKKIQHCCFWHHKSIGGLLIIHRRLRSIAKPQKNFTIFHKTSSVDTRLIFQNRSNFERFCRGSCNGLLELAPFLTF